MLGLKRLSWVVFTALYKYPPYLTISPIALNSVTVPIIVKFSSCKSNLEEFVALICVPVEVCVVIHSYIAPQNLHYIHFSREWWEVAHAPFHSIPGNISQQFIFLFVLMFSSSVGNVSLCALTHLYTLPPYFTNAPSP